MDLETLHSLPVQPTSHLVRKLLCPIPACLQLGLLTRCNGSTLGIRLSGLPQAEVIGLQDVVASLCGLEFGPCLIQKTTKFVGRVPSRGWDDGGMLVVNEPEIAGPIDLGFPFDNTQELDLRTGGLRIRIREEEGLLSRHNIGNL